MIYSKNAQLQKPQATLKTRRLSLATTGSSKPLSRRVFVEFIVSGRCSVWQWWLVNLSVGERRWMLHTISLTERLDHGFIRKRSSSE